MTTVAPLSTAAGLEWRDREHLTPWLSRHAVLMLAAIVATFVAPSGLWTALAATSSFTLLWYRERGRHALVKPYAGYANQLTALRFGFVLAAIALVDELPTVWLWSMLALNVAIDVGDGYVARRCGQVSAFGAVFDREVDALFVLAVYQFFFLANGLPAWVLLPGSLPYVFRLATMLQADRPPPDRRERLAPALAGLNFAMLLAAVASPAQIQLYVVTASALLVAASFLTSFVGLLRHDRSAAE
jgi:phosphatidylglycerophosphate synthase